MVLASTFALSTFALGIGSGYAQVAAPAAPEPHIDNIYGGFDHQPTEGEIQNLEQQDKVAPSPKQESEENQEVDKLYKELEGTPPTGAPRSVTPP